MAYDAEPVPVCEPLRRGKNDKFFRDSWLTHANYGLWIVKLQNDPTRFACLYCENVTFSAYSNTVKKHHMSSSHNKKLEARQENRPIPPFRRIVNAVQQKKFKRKWLENPFLI